MDFVYLETAFSHHHYNTVHFASPDKRSCKNESSCSIVIIPVDLLVHHPPISSIFSIRVISGAKSTPDLNKLLERKQAGCKRRIRGEVSSHDRPVFALFQ